jgi:hypothetical protein
VYTDLKHFLKSDYIHCHARLCGRNSMEWLELRIIETWAGRVGRLN